MNNRKALGIILVATALTFPFLCYFDLAILAPADIIDNPVECDTVLKFYYIGLSVIYSVVMLAVGSFCLLRDVNI